MSIERTPKDKRFTRIDRNVFEDTNLSFEAKGVLGYLLSQTDNWILIREKVIRDYGIGKDKLRRIVKELQSTGYLHIEQPKVSGRFTKNKCVIYESPLLNPHFIEISDTPQTDPPQSESPDTELPQTESSPTEELLLTTTDGNDDLGGSNDLDNNKLKKNNNSSAEVHSSTTASNDRLLELPACITGSIRDTLEREIKSVTVSDANAIIDQLNRDLKSKNPKFHNPTGWMINAVDGCKNGSFQPTISPKAVSDDKRRKRNEARVAAGSRSAEQAIQERMKNIKSVKPGSAKDLMK